MVLHPPNSALSPSLRSFSAACKAQVDFAAFSARLKPCPFKASSLSAVHSAVEEMRPYFGLSAAGCPGAALFAFAISGSFKAFTDSFPCLLSGS
jgi:hypothetical protein